MHSRNISNKYGIVYTLVEQGLQPIDYAWWQKHHTKFTLC